MSALRGLDRGFGDRHTFALVLLGLRTVVDEVVEHLPSSEHHGDLPPRQQTNTASTSPSILLPPAECDLALLGLASVKVLLDELCSGEPASPGPKGTGGVSRTPDAPQATSSGANDVRNLLR